MQSTALLKNDAATLPLAASVGTVAVIGEEGAALSLVHPLFRTKFG